MNAKISSRIFAMCLEGVMKVPLKLTFLNFSLSILIHQKLSKTGNVGQSDITNRHFYHKALFIAFASIYILPIRLFSSLSFYSSKILRIRYSFNLNWIVFTYVNWIVYTDVILPFYDVKCGRRKWTKKAEKLYFGRPLQFNVNIFFLFFFFARKLIANYMR